MLTTNLDKTKLYHFPLLFTIFNFIFLSNYIGMIPYSSTASTEIVITLT
jgi:F0F1-type ATP synthase membrane subunit a